MQLSSLQETSFIIQTCHQCEDIFQRSKVGQNSVTERLPHYGSMMDLDPREAAFVLCG